MDKLTTPIALLIWKLLIADPSLPMSWGVDPDSFECTEEALEFHVQGFLFTGNVRVVFIEGADLFEVAFYNEDGSLHKRVEDVYNDNLADVIDTTVENDKVGDYDAKILNFLINS